MEIGRVGFGKNLRARLFPPPKKENGGPLGPPSSSELTWAYAALTFLISAMRAGSVDSQVATNP
jgi:hypothetical protein